LSAQVRTQRRNQEPGIEGRPEPRVPGTQRPVPACKEPLSSLTTGLGGRRVTTKTGASECGSIWRLRRPHGRSRYRVGAIPRYVRQSVTGFRHSIGKNVAAIARIARPFAGLGAGVLRGVEKVGNISAPGRMAGAADLEPTLRDYDEKARVSRRNRLPGLRP
jgi:hypothetical protein